MKMRSISLPVMLLILLAAPALRADGEQSLSSIAGDWTLTRVGSDDGRTIRLVAVGKQLRGSYFTKNQGEKPITDASFSRGRLTFNVPDLQLYFNMQLVDDHFEGKMTAYSLTEKRAPESVRMTRLR